MSADSAVVVRWERPIAGRENHAVEHFGVFTNFLSKQQQQGNIESFEPLLMMPDGSSLGGWVVIRGSRQALDKLKASEEFTGHVTRADLLTRHFAVGDGWIGEGVKSQMSRYAKLVASVK